MPAAHSEQLSLTRENDAAVDYFGKLLERHLAGDSENDIRHAWRDFIKHTGIISDEREIVSEVPPGDGTIRRVDLRVRNTYIEFKRDIMVRGAPDAAYVKQLDEYLLSAVESGWGIQNGILTDGKHYLKRSIGDHILPIAGNPPRVFERATQGPRLREYLNDVIDTVARDIVPSSETLTRHLGMNSDLLKKATALLKTAHDRHREHPTVSVKRKLWQELLQVALGQDSAGDPDEADWLFVRHTYLATLTALVMQAHFGIDVEREADANPARLIDGSILHAQTGLKGVIESDLFQWPGEIGQTQYVRAIARKVAQFAWRNHRTEELAATLYQNTITPSERRKMGEYYTPRWLTQAIVDEMPDPLNAATMDPACGSGTFLESVAKRVIESAGREGLSARETLDKLLNNIIGIDLHPVAVQLAKATYVLSCNETITAARLEGHRADITPPVYLGDSLQLRYDRNTIFGQGYVTLLTTETPPGESAPVQFQIPMSVARQPDKFDRLMLDLARAVEREEDTDRVLDRHAITDENEREPMRNTAERMRRLRDMGRDHVWAYYLRNMVRPAAIADEKVDAIVGNPPWLTYSRSADIIREELQNLCKNTYDIWAGGKQSPHQDVSALFFARAADLYLKDGGAIGMVMPHSALRSGQYLKWRSGYWQTRGRGAKSGVSVDFRFKTPWDLDNLDPNDFFPMPGSVIFARRVAKSSDLETNRESARPLAPGEVEIWRGATGTPSVTRLAERLHHDDGEFHSAYADFATQGPTIVDRRLFFVSIVPNTGMLAFPDTFATYPRTTRRDQKKYDISGLNGAVVHADNLFSVYLGESVAPYIALTPLTAALPVNKATMTMPLDHSRCPKNPKTGKIRHSACRVDTQELDARMQERWPLMEALWDANKGKSDTKSLTQNLNWMRKLTNQLEHLRDPGDRPLRIAYTSSGRPTAAPVADDKAIIESTAFQIPCRNEREAHYLLAIINSETMFRMAEPFMPRGLFGGARHVQKHIWKLPIPEYDADNDSHVRLSRLGKAAVAEARAVIEGLDEVNDRTARRAMRHRWQVESETACAIETAVGELLAKGGS